MKPSRRYYSKKTAEDKVQELLENGFLYQVTTKYPFKHIVEPVPRLKEALWYDENDLPREGQVVRVGLMNGNVGYAINGFMLNGVWFSYFHSSNPINNLVPDPIAGWGEHVYKWRQLVEKDDHEGFDILTPDLVLLGNHKEKNEDLRILWQ